MGVGRLYEVKDKRLLTLVRYQLVNESPNGWSGVLVAEDGSRIKDGGRYIVELEDKRRGYCGTRADRSRRNTFRFGGKALA